MQNLVFTRYHWMRHPDLTTFMTPIGRCQFKRLPMGICVAPEIFQRKMAELLDGLPGVECFLDDSGI